jgi:hypothetical protein
MSAPTTSIAAAPALDKFPDWRRNYNSHPNWPCPPHENIQLAWGAITAWVDGLGAPESTATDARRIHIAVVIKELANALRRISHVAQALLTAGEGTIVTSIDSWRGHRKVCDDILTSAEEMLGHLAGALERCSDFSCPATLRATDAIIWLRTKGILTIDSDHRLSFTHESRIHAMTKTLGDTYRNMVPLALLVGNKATHVPADPTCGNCCSQGRLPEPG